MGARELKKIFEGVWQEEERIFTQNLVPGKKVYGEDLLTRKGVEYRTWNPFRSKLAAGIKKGLKKLPLKEAMKVLYLGAAEGTTISHISDIVGERGLVWGVDISAKVMSRFVYLCENRENLVPVLADASKPETYRQPLSGFKVDLLYQDVSQKDQAIIFLKNARAYLKPNGFGLLAIKARSISSEGSAKEIIDKEVRKLEKEFEVLQVIPLKPFEKDHALVSCKRK